MKPLTKSVLIIVEITEPIQSVSDLSAKGLDSIVAFHCDDKEVNNDSWEVIQFLPLCKIGVSLFIDNELIEIETEQKFVNCMKAKIASAARKDRKGVLGKQNNKVRESQSCQKLLTQHDRLTFEFKWVYFKNLPQYLIPFGAVVGTILLAFIAGTVWDCCCQKKEGKNYTKKGTVHGVPVSANWNLFQVVFTQSKAKMCLKGL